MFKFFRHIRHSLLSENKFSKYLLYAFGEIILVVIGILLALQINNWNERNKLNESISSHLNILQQNLREDQIQLRTLKNRMTENVQYADSAMLQIRTLSPVNNRIKVYLIKLILEHQFSPNTNAMETITQSNEIPSLSTDLRTAILNYYALIEQTREREGISNTQIQTKYEPYLNNHYPEVFQKDNEWDFIRKYYANDPRPVYPVDAQKLRSDKKLEPLLLSRYFQGVALEDFYQRLIDSSEIILAYLNSKSPEND